MPLLNDDDAPNDSRLKLLLLGDSKAGKTDYAVLAAQQGFNVLYIDGDVALQTIQSMHRDGRLSKEAMGRIAYMQVGDYINDKGVYVSRFAEFWKDFSSAGVFTWNDTLGEAFERSKYQATHRVWQIRPARMGSNDLIIFDSWTAYAQSVMAWKADTLSVDLSEVEKVARDIYSGVGNKLTQTLVVVQRAPCHVIVIGHPDEYVKLDRQAGVTVRDAKEIDSKVEWTKMVPKSSSKPHSLTMANKFSDVGWIEIQPSRKRKINFTPTTQRVVGGHFTDAADVDTRRVLDIVLKIGGPAPSGSGMDAWLTQYGPGEFVPAGSKPAAPLTQGAATTDSAPSSDAPAAAPIKLGGLAGLMSKQKGVEK